MKDKRLYHDVATKLTSLIDSGAYPPGTRLPGERELAERFGVSRVTVREAQIALQALGHIRIKTGSGAYALDRSEQNQSGFPPLSAFELTQARWLFESEGAALAAPDMTDETLARLEGHIARLVDPDPNDELSAEHADRDFHLTIAAASGNAAVHYVVELLWRMRTEIVPIKQAYASFCSKDVTARGAEHAHILDALRTREPQAARLAMREHFQSLLEIMLDATEEQELAELRRKTSESRRRFLKGTRI